VEVRILIEQSYVAEQLLFCFYRRGGAANKDVTMSIEEEVVHG
jgi:hypothetical protein